MPSNSRIPKKIWAALSAENRDALQKVAEAANNLHNQMVDTGQQTTWWEVLRMTREELEGLKYSLKDIAFHLSQAIEEFGKVGCTHHANIARAKIEFNRLINEELDRGRIAAVK